MRISVVIVVIVVVIVIVVIVIVVVVVVVVVIGDVVVDFSSSRDRWYLACLTMKRMLNTTTFSPGHIQCTVQLNFTNIPHAILLFDPSSNHC